MPPGALTVWSGHQPQSVLQIVAVGPPALGRGGGCGAKFWAPAGATTASTRSAAINTRRMVYYTVMRRWHLVIAVLAWAAGVAQAAPTAPGFRVTALDGGRAIDSRELFGRKVVVLRFQASYCKPCAAESAALARVAERYRDRVEVIAIHVQDTTTDTRAFMRAQNVTYTVALDPTLNLGNRFGFKGTPYTVVIDRKGEMVVRLHGVSVVNRLPRILDGLLK